MSYELPTLTDAEKSLRAIGWLGDSMRDAIQKMRKLERDFWKENGFIPGKEYIPLVGDVIHLHIQSKNAFVATSSNIYWEHTVESTADDCIHFGGSAGWKMDFIRRQAWVKIVTRGKEIKKPKNAKAHS